MGRDQATCFLEQEIDGTFLVRIRPHGPTHTNESAFALSLKLVFVNVYRVFNGEATCLKIFRFSPDYSEALIRRFDA